MPDYIEKVYNDILRTRLNNFMKIYMREFPNKSGKVAVSGDQFISDERKKEIH